MTTYIEKEFSHGRHTYLIEGECDADIQHERGSWEQPPATWIEGIEWIEPLTLSVATEEGWELLPSIPDHLTQVVNDMVDAIIYETEDRQ